jgi:uncharacterized protein YjbI with pentapeptide repeats
LKRLDPRVVAAVVGGLLLLALTIAVWGGYRKGWAWTGLGRVSTAAGRDDNVMPTKTLWDWMDLLLIPAVLALGAYVLQTSQSSRQQEREDQRARTDRAIASEAQREQALQQYLDAMTELMLDRELRSSQKEDEVRTVGRTRTLTVLQRLDGERRGVVLQFLHEANLIQRTHSILDLSGANLRDANVTRANLSGANLRDADLSGAKLSWANLSRADLSVVSLPDAHLRGANLHDATLSRSLLFKANLTGADLSGAILTRTILREAKLLAANVSGANLTRADLSGANLSGANLTRADLSGADLSGADLSGANLSGAVANEDTIWPDPFDPTSEGVRIRP